MINLLANLVDRALERAPVLQRRQRSLFEPAKGAALTRHHDDAADSLHEDEMLAESQPATPPKRTNEVNSSRISKPRSSAKRDQDLTETATSQDADHAALEPKRQPGRSDRRLIEAIDRDDESTIREESLVRDANDRHQQDRRQSLVEPAHETIMETKVEREVVFIDRRHKSLDEETTLLVSPKHSRQSTANDEMAPRRTDVQKETPPQIDASVVSKPAEQPRAARTETPQRPTRNRLEAEPPQRAGPAAPTINVTIGRVEVRAAAPAKRPESTRTPAAPRMSLEDYLRDRSKGN